MGKKICIPDLIIFFGFFFIRELRVLVNLLRKGLAGVR